MLVQTDVAIVAERQRMMEEWREWYDTKREWLEWHTQARFPSSNTSLYIYPPIVDVTSRDPNAPLHSQRKMVTGRFLSS